MPENKLPEFLVGTFDWRFEGLHLAAPAPVGLLHSDALKADNPWLVIAAVLENAKAGDHSAVPVLRRFFHEHDTQGLSQTAVLLVGDLGREHDLNLLQEAMVSKDPRARACACRAAALAGRLWLVPAMLRCWLEADGLADHETIGFAISDLLEPEGGPIAGQVGVFPPRNLDERMATSPRLARLREKLHRMAEEPVEFPGLVMSVFERLRDKHGTDRVTVWNGELFDLRAFALQFLKLAESNQPVSLFTYRHKFEANTGWDCRSFFWDGEPQFLEISAALEGFLETAESRSYESGVRYFFGHPIPD